MKWVSHEVVTGMAVYTLTGALVPTACAMAGAVLPDWIEGKGGGVRLLQGDLTEGTGCAHHAGAGGKHEIGQGSAHR